MKTLTAILFSCISCTSRLNFPPILMSDFEQRFGGIARLYGKDGLEKLRAAHVVVIGIGGVGTWAAEALARSGIGALTLVDLDEVCVTNINRQLHALTETVGRAKVEVMAERIRAINPDCRVMAEQKFFNAQTSEELFALKFDFVIDAIDDVMNKMLLLVRCREKNLPPDKIIFQNVIIIVAFACAGRANLGSDFMSAASVSISCSPCCPSALQIDTPTADGKLLLGFAGGNTVSTTISNHGMTSR